eukprot:CAMPEP_0197437898 /NCGR_PEP_ID=MMETSP1175-20131217/5033_1 /TAXON_ID=1003142 /ORGANISM="Triceratium dubium, Strain CCMP147" /LENGTH=165 /DNA_ID=CAMNT_0042967525 /DNA_START=232 /DNA_END=732 /DNA_ORIENTATION=+
MAFKRDAAEALHTINQRNAKTGCDATSVNELDTYLLATHEKQRTANRAGCRYAVFEEQWTQRQWDGVRDDEAIAEASRDWSKWANGLARATAEANAQAVRLDAAMPIGGYLCLKNEDESTFRCSFRGQTPQDNTQMHGGAQKYYLNERRSSGVLPKRRTIAAATA